MIASMSCRFPALSDRVGKPDYLYPLVSRQNEAFCRVSNPIPVRGYSPIMLA